MPVKLIDNEAFWGYRVRMTIAGKMYQEYFSLTGVKDRDKVLRKAERRFNQLKKLQTEARREREIDGAIRADGTVKGISLVYKKELTGNITPIYQVGIKSQIIDKIACTSFSINAHGEECAWLMAVEAFAKHKKIKTTHPIYAKLLEARLPLDERKLYE